MNLIRSILAASFLSLSASSALAAEASFERTLTVGSGADLRISTGSGHIHIAPGPDGRIHILAHVRSNSGWTFNSHGTEADHVRQIVSNPPIQQSGDSVTLGDTGGDRELYNNITIDYEITAPRSVALNLHTGSGDVEVDHVGRALKAESGSGSLRARGIAGPAELRAGSGDIELEQGAAGDVRASTGSGSIRVNGLDGGFQARTGSGDIEANGHLKGPANLQSGSGSIRLHIGRDARYNLDASTGSGTIRVAQSSSQISSEHHHVSTTVNGGGPTLQARTGSGDIEIN